MRKPKRRWSSNDCAWPSETTFSRRKCERTVTAAWISGVSSRRSTKLDWHTNSRQNQAWRISSIRRFFRLLTNDGSNRRAMSAFGRRASEHQAPLSSHLRHRPNDAVAHGVRHLLPGGRPHPIGDEGPRCLNVVSLRRQSDVLFCKRSDLSPVIQLIILSQ